MKNTEDLSPGTKALRKARCSSPRQVYSITSACICREKIFASYQRARLAAQALNSSRLWPDAKCLAWVVMPDHMHVLIELGDNEPLSLVVQRIKSLIAVYISNTPIRAGIAVNIGDYPYWSLIDEWFDGENFTLP